MKNKLIFEKEEQLRKLQKHPKIFPLMIKKLEREIKELKGE